MPKIINSEEDEIEDELEDEELDAEEIEDAEPEPIVRRVETRGRPMKRESPVPIPLKKQEQKPIERKRRYAAYHIAEETGIADVEANEKIASTIWEALANIIERLERIENNIGALQE